MSVQTQRTLFAADPARVCTIAGSDSGGGAGIQADLKTIQALGGYGLSVITALTAQNTQGVQAVSQVPPDFVSQQFASVTSDIAIDAFKIGMLANKGVAQAVAQALPKRPTVHEASTGKTTTLLQPPVVLDPVMVSTTGSLLLEPDAVETILTSLLPQCALITPNLPEASAILHYYGLPVPHGLPKLSLPGFTAITETQNEAVAKAQLQSIAMLHAAESIASHSGAKAVLLKGGHGHFYQADVRDMLSYLGVESLVRPVRIFGASNSLPTVEGSDLLTDAEGIDSSFYFRRTQQDKTNVSVVRTDLRPWSTVLTPQRSNPAEGLNVAPDVPGKQVVADVLCEALPDGKGSVQYRHTIVISPYIPSSVTHGTGCTLGSAIATYLASGSSLRRAVLLGIEFVQGGLLHGLDKVGQGKKPLNHAHALQARAVARRRPNPLPGLSKSEEEIKAASLAHLGASQPLVSQLVSSGFGEWERFVHNPFVQELGHAVLPLAAFKHFLTQDYLFLRQYANIWAMAASKAGSFSAIKTLSSRTLIIVDEVELHVNFCAKWGISRHQLERETTESRATLAYTRFVLDVGRRYAASELLVATLPCILGYAEVGRNLALAYPKAREQGNPYADWIETYSHERFQQGAVDAVDVLESLVEEEAIAPARLRTLQDIFHSAVKLEQGMWDEAVAVGRGQEVF